MGSLLQELLGQAGGEAAGSLARKPVARLYLELRRRLTLGHVVCAWVLGLSAMILGWRLGIGDRAGLLEATAVLLWFGGPTAAVVLTAIWWRRRDA